jgi:hypothetical protein
MTETLQSDLRFPTEVDGMGTDLQAAPEPNQPIQLIWIRPVLAEADAKVDTRGRYTQLIEVPLSTPWDAMNNMNRAQTSCRREVHDISGGRIP